MILTYTRLGNHNVIDQNTLVKQRIDFRDCSLFMAGGGGAVFGVGGGVKIFKTKGNGGCFF